MIRKCLKSFVCLGIAAIMLAMMACNKTDEKKKVDDNVSADLVLTSVSDTGVSVQIPVGKASSKQVGIFYFIWEGTGGQYPKVYDNTEILKNIVTKGTNGVKLADWKEAGGGGTSTFHWWGKPALGYYDMADEWVVTRHLQMLADANIDFMVVDVTNGILDGYVARIKLLMNTALKLSEQCYNVPKISFMCYSDDTGTLDKLYVQIFKKNPEFLDLVYHWNNHEKPVVFDNISGYNQSATGVIDTATKMASYKEGVTDTFEIRDVAFPHETKHDDFNSNSLLYLDFRSEPQKVTDTSENYSYINVSVAEICSTNRSSAQWFRNTTDRTRSWDGTQNLNWKVDPEAYLYGYNFARQFEASIEKDPDMIFITGWNEWIAQLQGKDTSSSIVFVDNADINNSRDIEPMSGGYGDNYYLQMCSFISKFKYDSISQTKATQKTIDVGGNMSQWDDAGILTYTDLTGETFARKFNAANDLSLIYEAPAADNDFAKIKVTSDESNVYFYVETVDDIKNADTEGNMMLLIKTSKDASSTSFDKTFVVNRTEGFAIEQIVGSEYSSVGNSQFKIDGNKLCISVSKTLLGDAQSINFKWVDGNVDLLDEMSLYSACEAAPYGRLYISYLF